MGTFYVAASLSCARQNTKVGPNHGAAFPLSADHVQMFLYRRADGKADGEADGEALILKGTHASHRLYLRCCHGPVKRGRKRHAQECNYGPLSGF